MATELLAYDRIEYSDNAEHAAMARGSRWLLNSIGAATNQDNLIDRRFGFAPGKLLWGIQKDYAEQHHPITPYKARRMEVDARGIERQRERQALAESLRVSRDPCPMCGVRGDIGCNHRRAA